MNRAQLLEYIIVPTLHNLDMGGKDAYSLLLNTAEVESSTQYIHQVGGGPALSFWQIEPNTHHDVVDNYISYRPWLRDKIKQITGVDPLDKNDDMLLYNMSYACAIARILYYRHPFPLPSWKDMDEQWKVYKRYYNTYLGSTTLIRFELAYNKTIRLLREFFR